MTQEPENFSVPWTGFDLLLFLAIWIVSQIVCLEIAGFVAPSVPPPAQTTSMAEKDHGHPITQLVEQSKNSPIFLFVAFLTAVVAAPLVEEFIFRLLFQGWLEAKFLQFHVPCASGVAVVTVSFCFAIIHAGNSRAFGENFLFFLFVAASVANLLIFTSGIIYLARRRNVKIISCIFGMGRFFHPQFFSIAGYCLLALLSIYAINFISIVFFPNVNTDPIPLFFFSLLLGTLYSKTRNLSYCILLHAFLNGTSLILVWLGAQFSG